MAAPTPASIAGNESARGGPALDRCSAPRRTTRKDSRCGFPDRALGLGRCAGAAARRSYRRQTELSGEM